MQCLFSFVPGMGVETDLSLSLTNSHATLFLFDRGIHVMKTLMQTLACLLVNSYLFSSSFDQDFNLSSRSLQ